MYPGVIASAVHTALRRGLAIAAVHPELNLRKPAYEEGEDRGPLQCAKSMMTATVQMKSANSHMRPCSQRLGPVQSCETPIPDPMPTSRSVNV
jgi:hypothetical protein